MDVLIYLFMERFFNSWVTMPYVNCSYRSSEINVLIAINICYKSTICRLYKRWDAVTYSFWYYILWRSSKDAAFGPGICSFTLANFLCSLRTPSFSFTLFFFYCKMYANILFHYSSYTPSISP